MNEVKLKEPQPPNHRFSYSIHPLSPNQPKTVDLRYNDGHDIDEYHLSVDRDDRRNVVLISRAELGDLASGEIPEIIRQVKRQRFPIRAFKGIPPPFDRGVQKRKMRWRHRHYFEYKPQCIAEPAIQVIQAVVQPYVEVVISGAEVTSVQYLAEGAFNKVYTVTVGHKDTGHCQDLIFRVAMPIYPYYKVESDVATTESVRHSTNITVPIIYAFDSSANNKLGFEWILM